MKLSQVHITEYQSVRDSQPFSLDDITCLVGKNESGKTAILQSLYRLNPVIEDDGKYDYVDDYPRTDVEDYQQGIDAGTRKPAIVVEAKFELSEDEVKVIEEDLGVGVLTNKLLTLSKGYENIIHVVLEIDEAIIIDKIIEKAQLPNSISDILIKAKTLQDLESSMLDFHEGEHIEHIERLRKLIQDIVEAESLSLYIYNKHIKIHVPKFLYFDEYYIMKGHENIEALKGRIKEKSLVAQWC